MMPFKETPEATALRKLIERDAPKTRGKWMMVHDVKVRRHTKASSVIFNILRDVTLHPSTAVKCAFEIEDALRRSELLVAEKSHHPVKSGGLV
jgi:hypothetical protein